MTNLEKLLPREEGGTMKLLAIILITLTLSGCACYDKEHRVFYGWGSYKDADGEITSDSPVKDIVSINWLKGG